MPYNWQHSSMMKPANSFLGTRWATYTNIFSTWNTIFLSTFTRRSCQNTLGHFAVSVIIECCLSLNILSCVIIFSHCTQILQAKVWFEYICPDLRTYPACWLKRKISSDNFICHFLLLPRSGRQDAFWFMDTLYYPGFDCLDPGVLGWGAGSPIPVL